MFFIYLLVSCFGINEEEKFLIASRRYVEKKVNDVENSLNTKMGILNNIINKTQNFKRIYLHLVRNIIETYSTTLFFYENIYLDDLKNCILYLKGKRKCTTVNCGDKYDDVDYSFKYEKMSDSFITLREVNYLDNYGDPLDWQFKCSYSNNIIDYCRLERMYKIEDLFLDIPCDNDNNSIITLDKTEELINEKMEEGVKIVEEVVKGMDFTSKEETEKYLSEYRKKEDLGYAFENGTETKIALVSEIPDVNVYVKKEEIKGNISRIAFDGDGDKSIIRDEKILHLTFFGETSFPLIPFKRDFYTYFTYEGQNFNFFAVDSYIKINGSINGKSIDGKYSYTKNGVSGFNNFVNSEMEYSIMLNLDKNAVGTDLEKSLYCVKKNEYMNAPQECDLKSITFDIQPDEHHIPSLTTVETIFKKLTKNNVGEGVNMEELLYQIRKESEDIAFLNNEVNDALALNKWRKESLLSGDVTEENKKYLDVTFEYSKIIKDGSDRYCPFIIRNIRDTPAYNGGHGEIETYYYFASDEFGVATPRNFPLVRCSLNLDSETRRGAYEIARRIKLEIQEGIVRVYNPVPETYNHVLHELYVNK